MPKAEHDTKDAHTPAQLKLTPEMASSALLVLKFVRRYIEEWDQSPSYGEIGNALNFTRGRARYLVKSLVRQGRLHRVPGTRGLSLPSQREDAIRKLRELGFDVDEAEKRLVRPDTDPTLPPRAVLRYLPDHTTQKGSSLSQDGEPDNADECRSDEESRKSA